MMHRDFRNWFLKIVAIDFHGSVIWTIVRDVAFNLVTYYLFLLYAHPHASVVKH